MSETIKHNKLRYNEKFIEIMSKLSEIMLKKGEPFRSRAYQKAIETILNHTEDITCAQQLKGKPNIGETIIAKLNEYVNTGQLQILENEKNNPVNILSDVYGIGPKKANELVNMGIDTIDKLRIKQHQDKYLNETQKVGLLYYEDILIRIPRQEIDEYYHIFKREFHKDESSFLEIVGSYRRGALTSGDIDVIVTSKSHNIFVSFIDRLIKLKLIIEVLSRGPTKCLVITKLNNLSIARRVDFLYTSQEEYPFSLLYFTGSKVFNTVMRHEAVQQGLSMNEHGLYNKKGNKVEHYFKNEQDIFEYLGLEYKRPMERIDGRTVTLVNKTKHSGEKHSGEKKNHKLCIVDDEHESSDWVIEFQKNGIQYLDSLTREKIEIILKNASDAYYNKGESMITDNQFDIIKEYAALKYNYNKIGVLSVSAKNKVTLPYFMGSMDKIKPDTTALNNWLCKYSGTYIISCKLDGVSGLYTTEEETPKLYTRGDGVIGQDVSHLIKLLKLPNYKGVVIRGEFIIEKKIFDEKYKHVFANPRNLVAGIINQKNIDEKIYDVKFVSYEVIKPVLKPSEQLKLLQNIKSSNTKNIGISFDVVLSKQLNIITNEILSYTLLEWRAKYSYEIDGVIVTNDHIYSRKNGNPEHAFAFKMVLSEQVAEATVVDVIWSPSKDGYLKPRIKLVPVNLGGVKIEYATGFNGAFIKDNNIGIGTIVELIRSGDVIPYVRKVTVCSSEPKMPDVPYKWNETNVDIILEDIENNEVVKNKNIVGFFRGIGVEGLSTGNIQRIVQAGYDSIPKIINITVNELKKIDGFQLKSASKIYDGIQKQLTNVNLVDFMVATNIFGRGFSQKKIELIIHAYPDVLISKESNIDKVRRITQIKGLADKSAETFVENINEFICFLREINMIHKLNEIVSSNSNNNSNSNKILLGKNVVVSGFRDNKINEIVEHLGGNLCASVNKKTFLLIVKDKDDKTSKMLEAINLGTNIMNINEFNDKYCC